MLLLRSLSAHAGTIGVNADGLRRALGISRACLDDPEGRIADAKVQQAWAELARRSGDDALGVHFAECTQEGDFEVLDYAVCFSSTLRDAIERIARFYRLLSDALAIRVLRDRGQVRIVRLVGGTDPHEQDAFFATICVRLRFLADSAIAPREVRFEHPRRATRELERFFRCPVRFGCACSELVFDASDLDRAARGAKPRLAALLDRYAAELLTRLPANDSFADHARHAIARVIQREPPTAAAVAREMHTSRRTLQRRLAEAGTTHKRLVDEVRRSLALSYVEAPGLSVLEIAYLLGYREESGFRRAFKLWTGKSPTEARRSSVR